MDSLQHFLQYALTPKKPFKPKSQESQPIYRDELSKKTAPLKAKKKVHFELPSDKSENLHSENGEKSGIRVKILMTKEEASRLLSKCKDGGVLGFEDAANELVRIPRNRVGVVCCNRKDE